MSEPFPYSAADELAAVRAHVRSRAATLGLPARRVELLALAVSELATNTLQHTDAGGSVRVWATTDHVICDVVDSGPLRSFGAMPPAGSFRGRGLAIVGQVADRVTATSTDHGTLVRMCMNR